MKKIKDIGKLMTLSGGALAGIMLVILARSFTSVPDGASPSDLAEAIKPWNVFASLGLFTLFVGLILWIVGWIFGRHNKTKVRMSNYEGSLDSTVK
jgi:hypothetical protein